MFARRTAGDDGIRALSRCGARFLLEPRTGHHATLRRSARIRLDIEVGSVAVSPSPAETVMRPTIAVLVLLSVGAHAQEHKRHPLQDLPLHEKFYSTWHMPDDPRKSCCNMADCYPTEIRIVDGRIYARRREDAKWLPIPPQKVEQPRRQEPPLRPSAYRDVIPS
jgi:hypothetical protein